MCVAIPLKSFTMVRKNSLIFIGAQVFVGLLCNCEGVINGEPAPKNSFTSTVRIIRTEDRYIYNTHCSGVIISEEWILTAAHCIHNISLDKLQVVAGDYDRFTNDTSKQIRRIKDIIYHPRMDIGESITYDLVLLQLTKLLRFTEAISSVFLHFGNVITEGNMTFAGWGSTTTSNGGEYVYADVLQTITLEIIDKNTCHEEYTDVTEGNKSFEVALCGLSHFQNASVCAADSGGGAFCWNGTANVLCGILSYNFECQRSPPAVFTVLTDAGILNWIRKICFEKFPVPENMHIYTIEITILAGVFVFILVIVIYQCVTDIVIGVLQ